MSPSTPPPLFLPPPLPVAKPGVLIWYRLLCGGMVCVWLAVAVFCFLEALGRVENLGLVEEFLVQGDKAARQALLAEKREEAVGGVILSLVVAISYVAAAFAPRNRGAWLAGCIAILASGFPFCLPLAVAIPLFFQWIKPETQRWFGRSPKPSSTRDHRMMPRP